MMQDARLISFDGMTIVATVKVTAFPDEPGIVEHDGRYYVESAHPFGRPSTINYHEVDPPVSV